MNIYKKLLGIQYKLKVPKAQYNSFGKYNYRSCEDILEAAKPWCATEGLLILLTDDVREVGGRVYIEAEAKLIDTEDGECISVKADAREDAEKKGMDGSQISGSASSYARKYALNGLFCLDDTKDSDATNTHGKEEPNKGTVPPPPAQPSEGAPPTQNYNREQMSFKCDKCGKGIMSYVNSKGEAVGARKHCEGSKTKFGQVLCLECIEKINAGGNTNA